MKVLGDPLNAVAREGGVEGAPTVGGAEEVAEVVRKVAGS